jgi:hypothetical protein
MPPHVLIDFVVFPPGHGSSVTDFWGWDAHEAHLQNYKFSAIIHNLSKKHMRPWVTTFTQKVAA